MLLLAAALAQDHSPSPEEDTEGRAPRFVLVLEDLGRTFDGKIVEATVGDVPRQLLDDGSGSDIHADDGLLCADIPSQPQQEVTVRITVDGELLDQHTLTLDSALKLPSVRVSVEGETPVWRVQEDEPVFTGDEDEDDDAWYIEEDVAPKLDRGTPIAEDHTVAAGAGLTAGSLLGGLLLLRRRRRRLDLRSLGSAPAKDLAGGTEPGDTETVVRALAATTNVLLLPRPGSRPALARALRDQPAALWLEIDRPSPQTVVAAADQLAQAGPLVVVVEGPEALEAPSSREAPLAAIEELKELCEQPVVLTT